MANYYRGVQLPEGASLAPPGTQTALPKLSVEEIEDSGIIGSIDLNVRLLRTCRTRSVCSACSVWCSACSACSVWCSVWCSACSVCSVRAVLCVQTCACLPAARQRQGRRGQ